ncbi:MAG: hypothetical protein M9892_07635 [Bacteroidetes bacterium]|nr:hypothetical protein [Bacteroidota bacterium]
MNINSIQTREELDQYANDYLVVDIADNPITGNKRKAAFFGMNANILQQTISVHVGVFEIDSEGELINTKALKPYEELLTASNNMTVNPETGEPAKEGIGEFDFFVLYTKTNSTNLWELFAQRIELSTKLNTEA